MNLTVKLSGLTIGIAILVALWLSVSRTPVPPGTTTTANEPARASNFMAEDIQIAAGLAYSALGNFDAARILFSRLRENYPSNALGYSAVAGTYMAEGQLIEALYWMREAQSINPRNYDHGSWMALIYDGLEDYEAAGQWSDWLNTRVTNQPLVMATLATHHYVSGDFEPALQYSNLALNFGLPDRWGSDAVFMRIKRDEALASGDPESGIRVFARQHPELFLANPEIAAGNISQATDLALLLKMSGKHQRVTRLLETVTDVYDRQPITGGTFRPDIVPVKAEALAIRGDNPASLAELRRIIDQGWRIPWRWKTDLNPNFDSLRQTEEFQGMVAELEADMAWQRSRVQAISVPGPMVSLTRQEEIQQAQRPSRE